MANLIGGMTIHVMENTDNGDVRVKDGLSRKLDIEPCENMTRLTWMSSIIRTLLLEGNGNAFVIPHYKNGLLESLTPVPYGDASIIQKGYSNYSVMIHGVEFEPDMLLHFVYNPDPSFPWKGSGLRAELRDIVPNLKQARITEKAFMSSKFRPSLIVKVDALTEEFSSKKGRKKLLDSYFKTTGAGEPWLIPAEQFSVEQVKPLSIKDMAIAETQQLDIKTVAAILGVPPFFLGVGDFNAEAWNHTVNTTFHSIAQTIEQELTRKLIISPSRYVHLNPRSLYQYDMQTLAQIGVDLYAAGLLTGNEVRDWISMNPLEGLDKLVILENYIPAEKIGDQKKLKGGEKSGKK